MRKMTILTLTLVVLILGVACTTKKESKNALTPKDLVAANSEETLVFDMNEAGGEVKRFLFEDLTKGCVYSIGKNTFIVAEYSEKEKARYYLVCKTKGEYEPIAISTTGNEIILKNKDKKEFFAKMENNTDIEDAKIQEVTPLEEIKDKKNSLLKLVEE